MISRARPTERSVADPTPEEIRQRSAFIRSRWTPTERDRRSMGKPLAWVPPVLSALDIPEMPIEGDRASAA